MSVGKFLWFTMNGKGSSPNYGSALEGICKDRKLYEENEGGTNVVSLPRRAGQAH